MIKDEMGERDLDFGEGIVGMKIDDGTAVMAEVEGGVVGVGGNGNGNPNCFNPMEEDNQTAAEGMMDTIGEKDLWLDRAEQEDLLDVSDSAIFYSEFSPLPDFPCMSSSSSSSSTPAASKNVIFAANSTSSSATTSSPAASWAVAMRSENEEDAERMTFQELRNNVGDGPVAALSSTASMELPPPSDHDGLGDVDCIDVMENFGYMDLIDSNEFWDPSSVFQSDDNPQEFLDDPQQDHPAPAAKSDGQDDSDDGFSFLQGNSELAVIFFEWLKQNKDYISAEDMRSIKLKRSTIESASKRLGTTKEGKKQLLKLILEWVGQYQLQKKRSGENVSQTPYLYQETVQNADPNANPNFSPNLMSYSPIAPNNCFSTSPWMQSMAAGPPPPVYPPPMMAGYGACTGPFSNSVPIAPMNPQVVNGIPYSDYHHPQNHPVMEHAQSWPPISPYPIPQPQFNPFPDNGGMMTTHQQAAFGNPYQMLGPNGERMMRLGSSATKEARKKRMARQRRLYTHHPRHNNSSNQHQNQMNDSNMLGDAGEDCDPGDWLCCPNGDSSPTAAGNAPPAEASQGDRPATALAQQSIQRQTAADRRQQQGWKTEKNLKFLLQKVLKQSDVGSLGRIVLPKKEAETHLPELESRDGIPIAMEDIGTSRVWNMRYRYWPNNKSRMYLLENTGDFVRVNGLQEGDFIVIYSDTKCGKYMIRGVKVRQPGTKLEGKKPAKRNMRSLSLNGNSSSFAPIKQAVR